MEAAIPGTLAVGVMLLWAEHDGGYDQDTWYWGALVLLAALGFSVVRGVLRHRLSRTAMWALGLFALYVGWSFLSITWASYPGIALDGSDRTLLYLTILSLFLILPWTARSVLWVLSLYALGIGAVGLDVMYKLAATDQVPSLFIEGRLAATTGYFNSSAALFTSGALVSVALSVRRELPGPVRGLMIAMAGLCLQLALIGESRGWLFTLPLVLIFSLLLVRNRFRATAGALIATGAALIPIHRLLAIYRATGTAGLNHAAAQAGRASLVVFGAVFVLGTLIAWADALAPPPRITAAGRRLLGVGLVTIVTAAAVIGGVVATGGHPVRFVKREWQGFSHAETGGTTSYFGTVGSSRYDFWRVALDAFVAHPIGGLGQDNFGDYYVTHRRTLEEPSWPHSIELRLLACTGLVGFALFAGFLIAALRGALRSVRWSTEPPSSGADPPERSVPGRALVPALCAAALLPLVDWLLHGSVDWFWEMPALSGPALGFLGMAASFEARGLIGGSAIASVPARPTVPGARRRVSRLAGWGFGGLAYLVACAVLGIPYLAVREVSTASNLRTSNTVQALKDVKLAAELNPLWSQPGRLGGTIALQAGLFDEATMLFKQATSREPGGWYAWFGEGLAESALGETTPAIRALRTAARIEHHQPVIGLALSRVQRGHPLDPQLALQMLLPIT